MLNSLPKSQILASFAVVLSAMVIVAFYRTGRLDFILGGEYDVPVVEGGAIDVAPSIAAPKPAESVTDKSKAVSSADLEKMFPVDFEGESEGSQSAESASGVATADAPVVPKESTNAVQASTFNAPTPGSSITLVLKNKAKQTGILEEINQNGIKIKTDNYSLLVLKKNLSSTSLAQYYGEIYVAPKVQKQDTVAPRIGKVAKDSSRPKEANTGDFAEYMRKHGETEELKAKKQRVQEYEDQRRKEGREY